jgi:CubicO group peptidase (beta-lactamase class C family)
MLTLHLSRFALVFFFLTAGLCRAEEVWITASPEEVGLDSAALVEMFDFVRQREIPVHSVQIVRHGRLALDAYFYPYSDGMRHDVASVTKSITSTLIGLSIDKGFLRDVQQPVLRLVQPRVAGNLDGRKRKLTLEHLLTMQAGWDCGFEPHEARLFEMRRSADWLQFMLDLPMVAEPGTRWAYCSGNCHLLSAIVTQITGTNALAFARHELFAPLGIADIAWPADARGHNHGWGDLQLHPRDMAKVGQLFLQRGRWKDRQVISEKWIRAATRAHVVRTSNQDNYGYFWWVKGRDYPGMFEAVGRGGQRINVWPAKDLVIVFTGGGFEPGDIAPFILKALKSDQPLPPNPQASTELQERLLRARKSPAPRTVPKSPAIAAQISGKTFELSTNSNDKRTSSPRPSPPVGEEREKSTTGRLVAQIRVQNERPRLATTNLSISTLALSFNDSPEAVAKLTWEGHRLFFPFGLDGVDRFSTNALTNLPQAAKGEWLDDQTFLLRLDLVGGINHYRLKLTFSADAKKLTVALSERTGLEEERFEGVMSD